MQVATIKIKWSFFFSRSYKKSVENRLSILKKVANRLILTLFLWRKLRAKSFMLKKNSLTEDPALISPVRPLLSVFNLTFLSGFLYRLDRAARSRFCSWSQETTSRQTKTTRAVDVRTLRKGPRRCGGSFQTTRQER